MRGKLITGTARLFSLLTLISTYMISLGHWYTSVLYDYAILFHGLA